MTEEQFHSLQNIYLLVAQVGSSFGVEDTSSGLVMPTTADNLAQAIAVFFPSSYQVHPEKFSQFAKKFCPPTEDLGVTDFLAHITPFSPEFALVGNASFDPKGKDKGEFHLCLFLPTMAMTGANLLICFNRAET
jgi:hypothetical protein